MLKSWLITGPQKGTPVHDGFVESAHSRTLHPKDAFCALTGEKGTSAPKAQQEAIAAARRCRSPGFTVPVSRSNIWTANGGLTNFVSRYISFFNLTRTMQCALNTFSFSDF